MGGEKWFKSGLNRIYLPMHLTDYTPTCCILTKTNFNHLSVTESPLWLPPWWRRAILHMNAKFYFSLDPKYDDLKSMWASSRFLFSAPILSPTSSLPLSNMFQREG